MEYLKAGISLLSLIKETNTTLLKNVENAIRKPNQMHLKFDAKNVQSIVMDEYSNDFVNATLLRNTGSEAFIITDFTSMDVSGKEVKYLLYKAYHSQMEKGMVFYQVIDKNTLQPFGTLEFSNMEDNIFYKVEQPKVEESSCNAMETDKVIENGKSIVFLIGHMDEDRLIYDIQRLMFDTLNNITKHKQLKFSFIIQVARYGGKPTSKLKEEVEAIDAFSKHNLYPLYPNAEFVFEFEEEE